MAVLLMAQTPHNNKNDKNKDCGNPIFHDFFGAICTSDSAVIAKHLHRTDSNEEMKLPEASSASAGAASGGGHGPVSATSDLASVGERQLRNHFQGVPVYSTKGDFSGPETSSRFHTKKRSNSDSAFVGLARDRMSQLGPETLENFHLMKMLRNSAGGECPRRSQDEEVAIGMQPPKPNSNSNPISQSTLGSRADSVASKWERSLINPGASIQYPSNLSQYSTYFDKERSATNVSASHLISSRDSGAGPSIISPPAADEGSRTGMKGSGILSVVNASNVVERNTPEVLISSHKSKCGPVSVDPDSGPPRQPGLKSASRQMTIFYAGQAHVFDEVHPNKADVIMSLAGSNGGSWSTSYSAKSSVHPSPNETTSIPSRDNVPGFRSGQTLLQRNLSSHSRFNQGGQSSTVPGSTTLKSRRPFSQPEEANSEGKHE